MTGTIETDGHIPWRMLGWSAAALVLVLPLVAMQLTDAVNWNAGDFVFAGTLILAVGVPLELVARKTDDRQYRAGAAIALAAALLLLWINGAVGITDSPADMWLLLVPAVAVAVVGAFLARFRPAGLALAMFAATFTQVAIAVVALVAGMVPAFNSPLEIVGINGFFVALFAVSGLLFRKAATGFRAKGGEE